MIRYFAVLFTLCLGVFAAQATVPPAAYVSEVRLNADGSGASTVLAESDVVRLQGTSGTNTDNVSLSGTPIQDIWTIGGGTGQAISLDPQVANKVLAGPESGSAAAPTFRSLVADDIAPLLSPYLPLTAGNTKKVTGTLWFSALDKPLRWADVPSGFDVQIFPPMSPLPDNIGFAFPPYSGTVATEERTIYVNPDTGETTGDILLGSGKELVFRDGSYTASFSFGADAADVAISIPTVGGGMITTGNIYNWGLLDANSPESTPLADELRVFDNAGSETGTLTWPLTTNRSWQFPDADGPLTTSDQVDAAISAAIGALPTYDPANVAITGGTVSGVSATGLSYLSVESSTPSTIELDPDKDQNGVVAPGLVINGNRVVTVQQPIQDRMYLVGDLNSGTLENVNREQLVLDMNAMVDRINAMQAALEAHGLTAPQP